jgi:DNA-binding protein HU-beta
MNQADLIDRIKDQTLADKKVIANILHCLSDVAVGELRNGGSITLPGLGKLAAKAKPARKGRNPKTGEEIDIPPKTVPHFSAAKALKDALM